MRVLGADRPARGGGGRRGPRRAFLPRLVLAALGTALLGAPAPAWYDETHLAVARAAGYAKWYNAAGADMAKVKAGNLEAHNHYVNHPPGRKVTPAEVLRQVGRYDTVDPGGHLYGAVLAAVRAYTAQRTRGAYAEHHMAFAAHYLGDLSMPLHNMVYDEFNRRNHGAMDGVVNDGILERWEEIRVYPVTIRSEADLAREVARVANLSVTLGESLRAEDRLPTQEEAYGQLGHSASVLRAVLSWTGAPMIGEGKGGASGE
ncbi:MAG: hypothetical protein SCH98_01570 [Deferrisomatales bacterium]|nr:hypothetical protein [Deferrisomatales bacterium]